MTQPQNGFAALGVAADLVSVLERMRLTTPTPIQEKTIPIGLEGKDIVGIAQTGTGKTLAFGLPILQRLAQEKGKGLIIAPTRELALQIDASLRAVGGSLGLRTAVLIGGDSMHKQLQAIQRNPHILVATPGRLNDHLEQKTVRLDNVRMLVLDEADRMLDMGFAPQIKRILHHVPRERQTMVFSATMPDGIMKIAAQYMALPVRVEIAPAGTAAEGVAHELFFVQKEAKMKLLEKLLREYTGTILVFSRTKFGAKRIARLVRDMGHTAEELHSNRSLNQRTHALEGFKRGKYRVLVATDIAARGIDVRGIELVINFDLPENAEDYVHRIGRTGRAGREGKAISFATPDQRRDVRDIEQFIHTVIPVATVPGLTAVHDESERKFRPSPRRAPYRDHRRPGFGYPAHGSRRAPRHGRQRPR